MVSKDSSRATACSALEQIGWRVVRGGDGGFYVEDPFGFTTDIVERAVTE